MKPHLTKLVIPVHISCTSCSLEIKQALHKLTGIVEVVVNVANEKVFVTYDKNRVDEKEIYQAIAQLGYLSEEPAGDSQDLQTARVKRQFLLSCCLSIPLMYFAMFSTLSPLYNSIIQFLLATPVIFIGRGFFIRGVLSLKSKRANT